ncbi:hypothetical protein CERZMDRAFT_80149 [Cercospora zeae-maydis SCOH1-5]|uniref:Uncharacterized protein n=1 Tax=Cercospora zeae-maydis SCOH1-5 TaxID=717836 RepID=A0A6A6FVC5_9PEZI|nr:hypothetical protein CERZMDRAFT_80149 [Cercospora zeae-maydis SCOH1-5]
MPFDPAIAGICATGVTKLVDTAIGEKCIHHAHRIADPREKSRSPRSRSGDSAGSAGKGGESDEQWSRKSYLRSGRHQQKAAPQSRQWYEEEARDDWSRKTYFRRKQKQQDQPARRRTAQEKCEPPAPPSSPEERRAAQAWEQRCDTFRDAKHRYVPPSSSSAAADMSWDEQRVYSDVGRAVREATRKASTGQTRPR